MQCTAHDPLYDIDPATGDSIEVFYADREVEIFGQCGAGWFWRSRRRGFSLDALPSDSSLRRAHNARSPLTQSEQSAFP
jgi:hypothetical protein